MPFPRKSIFAQKSIAILGSLAALDRKVAPSGGRTVKRGGEEAL
jgi:hypothetical protein